MQKEKCIEFLNKEVAVGVPHISEPRSYFYYGTLIEITDDYLVISFPKSIGYKQIQLEDITEIHLTKPRGEH